MKSAFVMAVVLAVVLSAFAVETTPYFPLGIGNSWTYQDSSEDGYDSSTVVTVGTMEIDGWNSYVFEETGSDYVDSIYYQRRDDGFYTLLSITEIELERIPYKTLPFNIDVGDEWTSIDIDTTIDVMGFSADFKMLITSEFEGFEDIETPLALFRGCIKVVATNSWKIEALPMFSDSGVDIQAITYYGDNVGFAYDFMNNMFYELAGVGEPPTASILLEYDLTDIETGKTQKPGEICIAASPNPFNSACRITAPEGASLEIYDLTGNRIADFTDNREFIWTPAQSISSGIYLVRAKMKDGRTASKRIVYLR